MRKEPIQSFANSKIISIEPKTYEEYLQVVRDCSVVLPNEVTTQLARLRCWQREEGPLKGQKYDLVVASVDSADIPGEDYEYLVKLKQSSS